MTYKQAIRIEIVQFVDVSQPGFVECKFVDASGQLHFFREKVPVVSSAVLDASSAYPQPGLIGCEIVAVRRAADGREIIVVDTELPWHVASTTGETRFEVFAGQIINGKTA